MATRPGHTTRLTGPGHTTRPSQNRNHAIPRHPRSQSRIIQFNRKHPGSKMIISLLLLTLGASAIKFDAYVTVDVDANNMKPGVCEYDTDTHSISFVGGGSTYKLFNNGPIRNLKTVGGFVTFELTHEKCNIYCKVDVTSRGYNVDTLTKYFGWFADQ